MLPLACGTKLKEVKIVIEFRNVSKVYDSTDTHALNHVNIKIEDGEFVFVVGSSGAGKSTFLKVLAGKLEADAGTISPNPNVQVSLLALFHLHIIGFCLSGNKRLYCSYTDQIPGIIRKQSISCKECS